MFLWVKKILLFYPNWTDILTDRGVDICSLTLFLPDLVTWRSYKGWLASQCGYVVSTLASRQGDPGSNPRAARKSCEVYPGLGILQPQWNPYPTLTPPSCWVRHVRSISDPQYGLVVCCVVSACDSTDSREISNDGNPSLSLHFKLSSLDGAQVVAADAVQRPARTPSTIYTQHSIYRSPDQKHT